MKNNRKNRKLFEIRLKNSLTSHTRADSRLPLIRIKRVRLDHKCTTANIDACYYPPPPLTVNVTFDINTAE